MVEGASIGKAVLYSIPPDSYEPQQLYHYTSIRGVEGVLNNKAVWASMLHFMNDSKEWIYALDMVRASLYRQTNLRPDKNWLAFVAELTASIGQIEGMNICAFSLSAMPNQLSQWRAYCPLDGGYNITFDVNLFRQHLRRHKFALHECIYDVQKQNAIINNLIRVVLDQVGSLPDDKAIERERSSTLNILSSLLPIVAPVLKHPDFAEEKEWRAFSVVSSGDRRMSYHVKGSLAIPHCVLDIQSDEYKHPIAEITVGPNNHQVLALRGLDSLRGANEIPIRISSTPLRSL